MEIFPPEDDVSIVYWAQAGVQRKPYQLVPTIRIDIAEAGFIAAPLHANSGGGCQAAVTGKIATPADPAGLSPIATVRTRNRSPRDECPMPDIAR
jgi:hypothetical protein